MNNLAETLNQRLEKKQNAPSLVPALLGDGSGSVEAAPNLVYYRVGSIVGIAYNDVISADNDLPVWIGTSAEEPQKRKVIGKITGRKRYGDDSNSVYGIGNHADQHRYPNKDTIYIEARQLMPFRITPVGGMSITVYRGIARLADGYHAIDTETMDLSDYIIMAETKAKYVTIEVNVSGSLAIIDGIEQNTDALSLLDIPPASSGGAFVGAVRIDSGMSEIVETLTQQSVFDPRLAVSANMATNNTIFTRILSSELSFADTQCLVITGYLDQSNYDVTLSGDAELEIL